MIYLDNAGPTKMNEKLIEEIKFFSTVAFFNPSASYKKALKNTNFLNDARKEILKKLGFSKGAVLFTSCATEANNLAINGSFREGNKEYLFSSGEHPSVYNTAKSLLQKGKDVKFIQLQKNGEINYVDLEEKINEKTRLVSCVWVSNETGAINDLVKISNIIKRRNPKTLFHVDAVQGFCKIPFNFNNIKIDFITMSGHKISAPKGVGALFVRDLNELKSISFGGEQEFSKRAGTENLPAVMAFSKQVENIDILYNLEKVSSLRKTFLETIKDEKISVIDCKSPYIISLSFKGVNGETLMRALENEVIISTGSACSSKKAGNRILEEMGFDKTYIKESVRVSFSPDQSETEILKAGGIILETYKNLYERLKWRLYC